jgi:hypothetical protein
MVDLMYSFSWDILGHAPITFLALDQPSIPYSYSNHQLASILQLLLWLQSYIFALIPSGISDDSLTQVYWYYYPGMYLRCLLHFESPYHYLFLRLHCHFCSFLLLCISCPVPFSKLIMF